MPSFARAFIALPEHLDFISQAVETLEVSQQRSTSKCISVLDLPGHGHGGRVKRRGPGEQWVVRWPGGVGSGGEGRLRWQTVGCQMERGFNGVQGMKPKRWEPEAAWQGIAWQD